MSIEVSCFKIWTTEFLFVSWLKLSNRMSIEASSLKIYVFLKSFGFNITHLSSSPYSFCFKPYFGEVLKKATWPPSPRVRPMRNWMWKVSWLKWRSHFSQSKFHGLRFMLLIVSRLRFIITRVSVLKPILGRSSRKPLDPPLHAYDQ